MKNILFITPFAPSNIGAAMKFTKKTIESLAETHLVDLVYFMAEGETEYKPSNKNIHVLKVYSVGMKDRLLSVIQHPFLHPIFSVRYRRELDKSIASWMKEKSYDLLFLDHSQSFIYGKKYPDIPKILMSHDVIYQRVSRSSGKLISSLCHASEEIMMKQPNANVFSFSTKDQDIIKKEYGISSYVTCGNIDDIAYSTYPHETKDNYIFFGQWVRRDNAEGLEWFLKEVYPKTDANMNIKIIGRGLSDEVKSIIAGMDRVEYLGFVDNPYQLIADSKAVLSPLFTGAGVKFKVLESLACGTPVIGNEIAFEGIPGDYPGFMLYAKTADEYIQTMKSINKTLNERVALKEKFIREYVNPYIVKHINEILK